MARPRFYYLLNVAQHALKRFAERNCQDQLGITAVQLGALFVVGQSPGGTQRELGRALTLKESAVTGLVGRMVESGLLERRVSEEDARARVLFLTARGRGLVKKARPLMDAFNERLTEGYTQRELAVVERFLDGVHSRFRKEPV